MKAIAINYVRICFLSLSSEKFQYEAIEVGLQLYHKRDSSTGVFLWVLPDFKNTFFKEHTLATASETITWYSEMWGDDGVIALCRVLRYSNYVNKKVDVVEINNSIYVIP